MPHTHDAISLAARALAHLKAGTTDQAPAILSVPIEHYTDATRYAHEIEHIFKRLPLSMALSIELPEPGCYIAQSIAGVPVIAVRGNDGLVRAFINACRHRGAPVCAEGVGKTLRFVCPYHSWSYDRHGALAHVPGRDTFGELDPSTLGLTALTTAECAGIVWVCLTPGLSFDIDAWLGDFKPLLTTLRLDTWHLYTQRNLDGAGWRVTMDGYLEVYHHDSVHGATVGPQTIGNLLVHDTFGPHQRMVFGRKSLREIDRAPVDESDAESRIRRIHSGFPNLSISGILGGYCLVSHIFPGADSSKTVTRQTVLTMQPPRTPAEIAAAESFSDIALRAVRDEDYSIAFNIQNNLRSGANTHFLLGRNEPAVQHYHRMIAQYAGR
jgi:phenylpropionate dioxygenase-like ring-hydroxylating dioxygenase large terminal subunit